MRDEELAEFERLMRLVAEGLPDAVKYRLLNAFLGLDRSLMLMSIDLEMASFRAINAEEEAASALLQAIEMRRYPGWGQLKIRMHTHKVALLVSIRAVQNALGKVPRRVNFEVDANKARIDVSIPFSELGVDSALGNDFKLQLANPLDVLRTRKGADGGEEPDYFDRELQAITNVAGLKDSEKLVRKLANERNLLIYASNSGLPSSNFNREGHEKRRHSVLLLSAICVMVLQTEKHQALVTHGMRAAMKLVRKLPSDAAALQPALGRL